MVKGTGLVFMDIEMANIILEVIIYRLDTNP